MEVVLFVAIAAAAAVVAVAVVGWIRTARLSGAIRNSVALLQHTGQQLAQLELARQSDARALSALANRHGSTLSQVDSLQTHLSEVTSKAAKAMDQHRGELAQIRRRTDDLQAALAQWLEHTELTRKELRAELLQRTDDLRAEQHSDQAGLAGLRFEMTSLRADIDQLGAQRQATEQQLRRSAQETAARLAKTERDLADSKRGLDESLRQLAVAFAGFERETRLMGQDLHAVVSCVWRGLRYDSVAGLNSVMAGGIYAPSPAAGDALAVFYEDLCHVLSAEVIFREPRSMSVSTFYLRWPTSMPTPREYLGQLLHAILDGQDAPRASPIVGAMRDLLRALQEGAPAAIRLGPLVAVCSVDGSVAGLLADESVNDLEAFVKDRSSLVQKLDPDCQLDLAALTA